MLHQVFTNIILKAIQAIEGDGQITISAEQNVPMALVTVPDTGCGVQPDNLSRVTKPFFTTKEPQKGAGLGLPITYSIMENHKGDLAFESEPGKGTLVSAYLPLTHG